MKHSNIKARVVREQNAGTTRELEKLGKTRQGCASIRRGSHHRVINAVNFYDYCRNRARRLDQRLKTAVFEILVKRDSCDLDEMIDVRRGAGCFGIPGDKANI